MSGMASGKGRVLVMTVGTGDLNNPKDTLFTPMLLSIEDGIWKRVVLLPSLVTEDKARELRDGVSGIEVVVHPLPKEGDEDNADRAYRHFDEILSKILKNDKPEDVEVDFTRGTKAMSAALVLAATRWGVPHLRYLTGSRDRRGMVVPGNEKIGRITTTTVIGHRLLDLARDLFRHGNFAAVGDVLPTQNSGFSGGYLEEMASVRAAARFFASWERLDYADARWNKHSPESPSTDWNRFWPKDETVEWVKVLADEPTRSDCKAMATHLRRLVVDLIANAERRVCAGQNEDALVRAYRVLELIGQARLFDHNLDSGGLEEDHPAVKAVEKIARRKNRAPFSKGNDKKLVAGRFQVVQLLKHCKDGIAARLQEFENKTELSPTRRNHSLLIHGFTATAEDGSKIRSLLDDLVHLARCDAPETFDGWLRVARVPAFEEG